MTTVPRAPEATAPNVLRRLLSFPNPVNEKAARVVAAGVVVMVALSLAGSWAWLLVPLAYGFCARVLTGPTLSPLGQLATRVVAPRLGPPRWTPGPPKRFAQAIGAGLSLAALTVWLTAGWEWARWLVGLLGAAAFLEAAFGICLGCLIFARLMRAGVIPASVCEECADVVRRHPGLAERT
ncbi:MAG TPA: DUF4395 domain-containing protein [Acidimicrobiales bacterium]|nr:DUF4395 domain-containing protein [Acidimicrobiales bacterium]